MRAIDLAGNVDPTPASTSFVTAGAPAEDTTPPDTTIAGATVTGSHARLTFSSNDTGAHFQCQLDGGAFAACTSPVDYSGLADGAHTFRARAIDAAGNVDPTPATRTFTTLVSGSTSGDDLPELADPGRRRRVVAGRHGDGRPHGSARDGRQAHAARLGQGRRDRAGLVPAHRGQVPHRPAPEHAGRLLARRTVTVAGGKSANVSLQMSKNGRVSLARRRTLMTEVTTTARDAAGNQATTRTPIRLLAPRRR